ncbi:hypothetical protein [Caulobacter phage Cr30]|uniref:hypothetical protein n=1 Tax=Caulobacter phage Cr30 TaxID=1357714 RepID=UPI0004A9BB00|nr:hypothetical protein OZ74_gp030 [Caulobacter phage Cr30]AGS80915.1 hypothetical protein [Caulobacter phage Cr30]
METLKVFWKIQRRSKSDTSEYGWLDHETIKQEDEWKLKSVFNYYKEHKGQYYDWRVIEVIQKERGFH